MKPLALARAAAVALSLLLLASGPARAQDSANLAKVGNQLARLNKPGSLFAYIRDYHAKYFEVADKAGLAEALDGKVKAADFEKRFQDALKASSLSDREKATLAKVHETVRSQVKTLEGQRGQPVNGVTAERMRAGGDVVSDLRTGLFTAESHWISRLWEPDKRSSVGVKFLPGRVAWFNPSVSIPELGIKAGVPLTDAQKESVVRLFSFVTVPDAPATAEGTAAFPNHVGRAVNPNSHVLTILNERGEVISDIVVKGGGPNKPNATRDGRLDYSEAMMDSEVARNISRAGVRNYDGLCVIIPDGLDGKALLVRTPRTMMRHLDFDKLNDKELKETLERLAKEVAIREGLPKLSIADWAKTYLPRVSGENWGLLTGLGVEHGSNTRDNHGVGETVDWGWVALHESGGTNQSSNEWEEIETSLRRINAILPDAEKVDIAAAKKVFDAAFEKGKEAGSKERIRFDPKILEHMTDSDLRTLVSNLKDPNTGTTSSSTTARDEALERLKAGGRLVEHLSLESLVRLPLAALIEIARHNGQPLPTSVDRAGAISALTGKPRLEVNREIVKARRTTATASPTDGMSDRLRDLIDDRLKERTRRTPRPTR